MTSEEELLSRGLPKWPGLLVVGNPVSLEDAEEIIIRTARFFFSSNDDSFTFDLYKALDVPHSGERWPTPDWNALEVAEKKYGNLSIEYLNNSRVVSAYVGGPHGWCDWEGNIGCNSYNIGRWPSVETVYAEWKLIATTFPFLNLKSQLFSGETCEDGLKPIVQFDIANGVVLLREPDENIGELSSPNLVDLFAPGNERGCTIQKFNHALQTTLKRLGGRK